MVLVPAVTPPKRGKQDPQSSKLQFSSPLQVPVRSGSPSSKNVITRREKPAPTPPQKPAPSREHLISLVQHVLMHFWEVALPSQRTAEPCRAKLPLQSTAEHDVVELKPVRSSRPSETASSEEVFPEKAMKAMSEKITKALHGPQYQVRWHPFLTVPSSSGFGSSGCNSGTTGSRGSSSMSVKPSRPD